MRTPRKLSPADIYHIVARGTGRQLIFEDDEDRQAFMRFLEEALDRAEVELYAWCLMGNHVHLLVHAPMEHVSSCMKFLLGRYSQWFNAKSGRVGHLFQERFRSEPIDTDAYLATVVRYIHANPEKAGVGAVETYPWSSYQEYTGEPQLCSTEFVLSVFGGVESFVKAGVSDGGDAQCIDIPNPSRARIANSDEQALAIAQSLLDVEPNELKTLPKKERDLRLATLKGAGLSVRQVERITGIGRNTVSRA